MKIVVFDLEWNQPHNGKTHVVKEIPFEIIEIGAVKLNKKREIVSEFNEVIKPSVYKELHYIIKQLVHIQKEDLENGKSFHEVITQFLNWSGRNYIFATWGTLDLIELQRNMKYYGRKPISNKPLPYLDAQKLFSMCFEDGKSRRTLSYAVDFLGIEKTRPFHRALSDAYYTAKVIERIDERLLQQYFSYDVYERPKHKKDEIKHKFPTYFKYISREFPSKTDAFHDDEVASTRCHICNRKTTVEVPWFSNNGKHYYGVSRCKKHGFIKGKIRIKKTDTKNIYIVKTMKLIGRDLANQIRKSNNSEATDLY